MTSNENGTWLKILLGGMITVFCGITAIQFNAIASNESKREEKDGELQTVMLQHEAKFAKFEGCMESVKEDLSEIKSILKRTSPYERETGNRKNVSFKDSPVPTTY